jgi:hypothetical protein
LFWGSITPPGRPLLEEIGILSIEKKRGRVEIKEHRTSLVTETLLEQRVHILYH